jgi:hypothetical protein
MLKDFLIDYQKKQLHTKLSDVDSLSQNDSQSGPLYCIALVCKEKFRDHQLENILLKSDNQSLVYNAEIDYIVLSTDKPIRVYGGYFLVKSVLRCKKWKTMSGAKKALDSLSRDKNKSYYNVRPYVPNFSKENYVLVIYDIGGIYRKTLLSSIEDLNKSHQKKLERLNNQLKKYST